MSGPVRRALVLALLAGNTPLGISRPNPQPLAVLTNPAYLSPWSCNWASASPRARRRASSNNLKPVHREEFANYGENTAYDVYADGTFKLTDKFEITAGLRYTSENRPAPIARPSERRSILGILLAAPTPTNLFLAAQPNAVNNPLLPIVGLIAQPTTNNGDSFSQKIDDSGLTWRLVGRYAASTI
jgi:iron complex outermembrane receptor protein